MNVTVKTVENILSTLPVGYYLKRGIVVTLSTTDDESFYMPVQDEVVISYKQLSRTFDYITTNEEIEPMVRCMLYHEISHAMLTPKNGLTVTYQLNVVEDERIETICKDFYLDVDFKQFIVKVNKFTGQAPRTADEAFYQLVRYRIGERKWLDRLNQLLRTYSSLTRSDHGGQYEIAVNIFYNEFIAEWSQKPQNTNANRRNNGDNSTDDNNVNNANAQNGSFNKRDKSDQRPICTNDDVRQLFDKELSKYDSKQQAAKLEMILSNINRSTKLTSSAINAYSGVFNARSVVRDDYKYFVQQNRFGHIKQFTKLHLNLFIDHSASFAANNDCINQLLNQLIKLEKKLGTFTFDVVTIDTKAVHIDKRNYEFKAHGGTCIPPYLRDMFKQLQKPGEQNINIVLFDGDCIYNYSRYYCSRQEAYKQAEIFNRKDTIVISDPENNYLFKLYCKNAQKVIITKNYTDELFENVYMALSSLIKIC